MPTTLGGHSPVSFSGFTSKKYPTGMQMIEMVSTDQRTFQESCSSQTTRLAASATEINPTRTERRRLARADNAGLLGWRDFPALPVVALPMSGVMRLPSQRATAVSSWPR